MMINAITIIGVILMPVVALSSLRGNVNLSYRESDAVNGAGKRWSAIQILNLNFADKIFYANDFQMGAYILRSENSLRDRPDLRVRYTLNMSGYRYSLYSSYSPYKIASPNAPKLNVRNFQASLNYQPKMLPDIFISYASTRKFSDDKPRSVNSSSDTWNLGSQISKSFGNFRGNYQRQQSKADIDLPERHIRTIESFSYDIGKTLPGRIAVSASYSFSVSVNKIPNKLRNESRSHTAATQASRRFGKWFSISAAVSGRKLDFYRNSQISDGTRDLAATSAGTLNLKHNLSIVFLRSYSSNKIVDDTTTESVNDYLNIGGNYRFMIMGGREGSLTLSRSIYLNSNLGRTIVDNASLIMEVEIYRNTEASVNIGVSHNSEAASGQGRYQLTRNINILSRPRPKMTITISHQASMASASLQPLKSDNENLTVTLSHTLKHYFNYTITYNRSTSITAKKNVISSISAALNYYLSRTFSLLLTYTRRDLGDTATQFSNRISQSASGRIGWLLTRKSSLTLDFTVTDLNTPLQSRNLGGYFVTSF